MAPVSEDFRAGLASDRARTDGIYQGQAGRGGLRRLLHNYLSLTASFNFMKHEFKDGRLIVVIGAAGARPNPAVKTLGALSQYADVAI